MVQNRFSSLDGWRGISILLVLATHLLPLGPKLWEVNATAGPMGMALFFTLSGFLITNFLLHKSDVTDFIIRRFFRIVPLAWLYVLIALLFTGATIETWAAHLFFYGNSEPYPLIASRTSHLWSLCVEIQFYIGVALLVGFFSQRALVVIPLLCLGFTAYRVANGVLISINTGYRIDEILAGSTLALIYNLKFGEGIRNYLSRINPYLIFILLIIASSPLSGWMNYFRPYMAAILVGVTLLNGESKLAKLLDNRALVYIATISFALYVIHPLLTNTWLGDGEKLVKYAKRPLFFIALFMLAHCSTFYFEKYWINLGKKLSLKVVRD
jgi:peptidoglycan/LPS O-acetylase OafA/YrhL